MTKADMAVAILTEVVTYEAAWLLVNQWIRDCNPNVLVAAKGYVAWATDDTGD